MIYDVNGNAIDGGHASEKYNVPLHFQRGAFSADETFGENYTEYVSSPATIFNVDEFVVQSGYQAAVLLYSDNTYLGKIRPDMTLDKAAGNWKWFTGTVDIRGLLTRFEANGFRLTISVGSTVASYADAYNGNWCEFYSYTKPTDEIIQTVQLSNGSFKDSNKASYHMTYTDTRVRTYDIIPVKPGDVFKVNTDNGKYDCSYTLWKDVPSSTSRVAVDVAAQDNAEIRIAFSGYFLILFSLAGSPSTSIPLSSFTGGVTLKRYSQCRNVIENNPEQLKYALGSQRIFTTTFANNNPANNCASFVHVSDVHGDATAFQNAYDAAKYLGVTAFVATGDMVYYYSNDDFTYVTDAVSDKETEFIMCMGNHDGFQLTAQNQYAKFIEPFVTDYGYQLPQGVSYPTYYYKDFAEKLLRVLVINQFEYDGRTSTTDTRMCFTQNQVDFIVSTLLATPENYGVLIAMHTPETLPAADNVYTKFSQSLLAGSWASPITIVCEIMDAFISKTTLTKTFSNPSGASPSTVTVNADFTGINSGVEFIAYMTGHYHADRISYVPGTTNMQLMLNVTTANSWSGMRKAGYSGTDNPYLTEGSDLARVPNTPTQDAFNVYAIDRAAKNVKVVRIGSNMSNEMKIRDYMAIPYKLT